MFTKKTCDNCHTCTNTSKGNLCAEHSKTVCDEGVRCLYYLHPDCALVSYHINQVSESDPVFTKYNFKKLHRACEEYEYCRFRFNLKTKMQICDCDYNDELGTCTDHNCEDIKHVDGCSYLKCYNCYTGPCQCSYYKGSCGGNRCRNESHRPGCGYRSCEACFGYSWDRNDSYNNSDSDDNSNNNSRDNSPSEDSESS